MYMAHALIIINMFHYSMGLCKYFPKSKKCNVNILVIKISISNITKHILDALSQRAKNNY